MATYNGLLCSLTTTLGGVSISTVNTADSVPAKYFKSGYIALTATQGISTGFYCNVFGMIGGATFIIAGRTAITTVGTYIMGTTSATLCGTGAGVGSNPFPRPSYAQFGPTAGPTGFTASVYVCGEY